MLVAHARPPMRDPWNTCKGGRKAWTPELSSHLHTGPHTHAHAHTTFFATNLCVRYLHVGVQVRVPQSPVWGSDDQQTPVILSALHSTEVTSA